jgi:hypothetical protein
MNYIDELWEKSINDAGDTMYSVISKKQFMRVLTEALGKQREMSRGKIKKLLLELLCLDDSAIIDAVCETILNNKLEASNG